MECQEKKSAGEKHWVYELQCLAAMHYVSVYKQSRQQNTNHCRTCNARVLGYWSKFYMWHFVLSGVQNIH